MDWETTLAAGAVLAIASAVVARWVRNHARPRQVMSPLADRHSHASEQAANTDSVERRGPDDKAWLLARAVQSANDCVSITDSSDCILYANDAFLRTYEYDEGELLGQHISIVLAQNDPDMVKGIADGTRGEGWRGTLWNRSKSGRVFPVSLTTSAIRDDEGGIVAAIGIARDMTREMATEEALRRTEMRYRAVVENTNDIIFTVDREGHCLSMNRAGRTLTGYVAEDARGIHLSQLVAPHHVGFARQQLERVLAGEDVPAFELAITNRDGCLLTLELAVHALPGENGPSGVQGIARDITARKELEDQLRQAQKMEALGRLAGGIAHDFNNLLTAIAGYSALVSDDLPPDSAPREHVGEIQRAASLAGSLTRQLLILSRKDPVHPVEVDLNESVTRIERMLRRIVGEGIEFIVRVAPNPGYIHADAGQIEQLLMNLVINARDAMPSGGTLRIETAAIERDESLARRHPGSTAGPFVRLTVTDTGCGMTPEVQAQIFTPFFTTKSPSQSSGTGLGLAIVHGIVRQWGGWIELESAIGQGTRFSIYFPRHLPAAACEPSANAPPDLAATGSATILFVEDDECIRTLGTRMLRLHGFSVLPARHATEALQLAVDRNRRIDLLLTDIVLPGLSGRDLAAKLLQTRPGLKVLYTSGYSDDVIADCEVQVNTPGFVRKPYSPDALVRQIRTFLASD
jgi:two-component system, cell cycle sensor histidine kinase and response regulator CckA